MGLRGREGRDGERGQNKGRGGGDRAYAVDFGLCYSWTPLIYIYLNGAL